MTGEPDGPPTSEALGHPEWCEDRRFATNEQRMQNRAALEAEIEAVLTTAARDHWVEVLERLPIKLHRGAHLLLNLPVKGPSRGGPESTPPLDGGGSGWG